MRYLLERPMEAGPSAPGYLLERTRALDAPGYQPAERNVGAQSPPGPGCTPARPTEAIIAAAIIAAGIIAADLAK